MTTLMETDLTLTGIALNEAYCALRARAESSYTPHRWRQMHRQAQRMLESAAARPHSLAPGKNRAAAASLLRERADQMEAEYYTLTLRKWCLAILRGAYDLEITQGRPGGTSSDPDANEALAAFSAERRRRLGLQS